MSNYDPMILKRIERLERIVDRLDRTIGWIIRLFRRSADEADRCADSIGGATQRDPGEGDRRYDFGPTPPRESDY